jgi:hypothetical protein
MKKLKYLVFLILFINIVGCFSLHKAEKLTKKIYNEYPEVIAKVARDKFPCKINKLDTIVNYKDSTIWIDCPDSVIEKVTLLNVIDTILIYKKIKIKVPVNLPVKTITIVKEIEDLSKIVVLDTELTKTRVENEKMAISMIKRNKVIKWLIFALVGFIIPYLLKIIRLIILKK